MQITSNEISNTLYVQIYLTKEEFNKKETKEVIDKYKKEKCSLGIFITGKENYPEILKKIVNKQVDLHHNAF